MSWLHTKPDLSDSIMLKFLQSFMNSIRWFMITVCNSTPYTEFLGNIFSCLPYCGVAVITSNLIFIYVIFCHTMHTFVSKILLFLLVMVSIMYLLAIIVHDIVRDIYLQSLYIFCTFVCFYCKFFLCSFCYYY